VTKIIDSFDFQALVPKIDGQIDKISGKEQYLTVDSRPVSHSRGIFRQVYTIFKDTLHKDLACSGDFKEPFLFLSIKCPPSSYDVNIEPSKNDVLFSDPHSLINATRQFFIGIYRTEAEKELSLPSKLKKTDEELEVLFSEVKRANPPNSFSRPPKFINSSDSIVSSDTLTPIKIGVSSSPATSSYLEPTAVRVETIPSSSGCQKYPNDSASLISLTEADLDSDLSSAVVTRLERIAASQGISSFPALQRGPLEKADTSLSTTLLQPIQDPRLHRPLLQISNPMDRHPLCSNHKGLISNPWVFAKMATTTKPIPWSKSATTIPDLLVVSDPTPESRASTTPSSSRQLGFLESRRQHLQQLTSLSSINQSGQLESMEPSTRPFFPSKNISRTKFAKLKVPKTVDRLVTQDWSAETSARVNTNKVISSNTLLSRKTNDISSWVDGVVSEPYTESLQAKSSVKSLAPLTNSRAHFNKIYAPNIAPTLSKAANQPKRSIPAPIPAPDSQKQEQLVLLNGHVGLKKQKLVHGTSKALSKSHLPAMSLNNEQKTTPSSLQKLLYLLDINNEKLSNITFLTSSEEHIDEYSLSRKSIVELVRTPGKEQDCMAVRLLELGAVDGGQGVVLEALNKCISLAD
jgi:DNA mismatch repair ATPase MutL